jgi:hypothetical protein
MLEPIAGGLATRHTRDLATSARPDAPVMPDPQPAPRRPVRHIAALALHRIADRLDPTPRLSVDTVSGT